MTVSNSVLNSAAGSVTHNCSGTVRSLGYNSVPGGAGCGFDGPGDGVAPGDFVRHDPVRQNGRELFAPNVEETPAGSPDAFGSSPSACEPRDVRGYLRVPGRCDRGAFDHRATPDLNPGLDGLWFDPDHDGQYLQLSHFGRNQVLLMWQSFDADGNPLWVYGIGPLDGGDRVEVEAFRNTGVRLDEGVLQGQVQPERWGVLSVRVRSCRLLEFRFEAIDGAGVGEYRLRRLTDNAAAGCFDRVDR